jgi:hypothetical protein
MSKTTKLSGKLLKIKRYWMEAFAPDGDWRPFIAEFVDEDRYAENEDYFDNYVEIDFGGDDEMIAKYFSELDPILLADRELVFAVTSWDGLCLKYADEKLKDDKDLVINAIDSMGLNMGRAFGFASRRLQEDSDVRAEFLRVKNKYPYERF